MWLLKTGDPLIEVTTRAGSTVLTAHKLFIFIHMRTFSLFLVCVRIDIPINMNSYTNVLCLPSQWGQLLKERICSPRSKFCPSRVDLCWKASP